ncbi:MAG: GNAT family N-acetyltransferase [Sphingomonas sp.]|nr:GNAT family N-acetyltransferase [Sphingomonas sp.]
MDVAIRIAGPNDAALFGAVADEIFDNPVLPALVQSFLTDSRHHVAIATAAGRQLVGFASAVDYIHPDKPRELWINEVGVARNWQKRGIGKALLRAMLDHGRTFGCAEAWVLTEPDNAAANALYRAVARLHDRAPMPVVMYSFGLD